MALLRRGSATESAERESKVTIFLEMPVEPAQPAIIAMPLHTNALCAKQGRSAPSLIAPLALLVRKATIVMSQVRRSAWNVTLTPSVTSQVLRYARIAAKVMELMAQSTVPSV